MTNPAVLAAERCPSDIREYGIRNGLPHFAEATWEAGFIDGWRAARVPQTGLVKLHELSNTEAAQGIPMSPVPHFQYHVSYHWTVDNHRFGSVQQGFGEDTVTLDGPLDSVDQLHELRKFLAEHHPDQPCEVVIIAWNLL